MINSQNIKLKIMAVRAHLKIIGQVQGVFFRRSAKIEADKLGIVGWVKNSDDGSVEVMAQGEKGDTNRFIKWCKKGPPFAKIEKVDVHWEKELHDFDDFSIHE